MEQRTVEIREMAGGAGPVCRAILATLPDWFGIPEANDAYVRSADVERSVVASVDGEDVGITTVVEHFEHSAEVHLMAVVPGRHRQGIGRAMLEHVERDLASRGVEFLQVKTLSSVDPDEGYGKTRAFYLAYGFRPLEEFPTLWDPQNPALQMIKTVAARP